MRKRIIFAFHKLSLLSWSGAVLFLVMFIGAAPMAQAQILFGSDSSSDQLIVINQLTGEGSAVGPTGFLFVDGLGCDFNNAPLFGSNNTTPSELITLNVSNGDGTFVGDMDFNNVEGMTFDTSTGTLYGSDITGLVSTLIIIDPATGNSTAVGGIGAIGFNEVRGLAYDSNSDILYGVNASGADSLITIDRDTGVGTLVGPIGFNEVRGLAYNPITSTLFATQIQGGSDLLLRIDPATGAGTEIGEIGFDFVVGLAVCGFPNVRNIPTLNEWGLIALAAVMGIAALFVIRRRMVRTY